MLTSPPLSGVRRGRLCRGVGAETVIIRISRDLRICGNLFSDTNATAPVADARWGHFHSLSICEVGRGTLHRSLGSRPHGRQNNSPQRGPHSSPQNL